MTESSPQLPPSSPSTPPPQRRKGSGFGGALIRLVFLGLVGAISTGGGVALAVFFPSRNPQPPFLETALQNLRLIGETRVAPSVSPPAVSDIPNSNNSPEVLPVSPVAGNVATPLSSPVPDATSSPANSPNSNSASPTSSPTSPEAAQLQQDLQQVRQQFKELGDRTTSLEQKLGLSDSRGSLEIRLDKLSQQLQTPPTASDTLASPSPTSSASPTTTPSPDQTIVSSPSPNSNSPSASVSVNSPASPLPIAARGTLQRKITLPTDPLFDSNSNILRPESILLLSQVVSELKGIAGGTIQVTVHSNLSGDPNNDRRLSFQQAKAIREYLATQLGDRFRFVAIGYGSTRPLVMNIDRPENRRIEIIVE